MANKKQQSKKKLIEDIKWRDAAKELARDMHENHFDSHYGWGRFPNGFYYYNNHPTHDGLPLERSRDGLLASIRAWLKEQPELAEVAFASYDDGYTIAMIITGPRSAEEKFEAAMDRLTRRWRVTEAEPQPLAEVIDIKRARSQVEA